MSRALSTSASPAAAPSRARSPLARPQLAGVILTATAGVICGVMFLWLLVTPLIRLPAPPEPIWSLALPLPDGASPPVGFREADAMRLSSSATAAGAVSEPPGARLERELGGFLDRHSRRPVILYLASAIDASGESADANPALRTAGESLGTASGRVPLDDLIRLLKTRGKDSSKLLVLDVGQIGPDRNLGLAAPDLPAKIEELIGSDSSVAVLLANAPGQISWVAEDPGTSVFAHYLSEALGQGAGRNGRVSAGELLDYVGPRVQRWVASQRSGAVQTPVLIGNRDLRLALPRRGPVAPAPGPDADAVAKLRAELLAEWSERRRLASQPLAPNREAPIAWRSYQDDLLNAERLMRSGSPAAGSALVTAIGVRETIERAIARGSTMPPLSLAVARNPGVRNLKVAPDAYETAVVRLLDRLAEPGNDGRNTPPAPQPDNKTPADGAASAKPAPEATPPVPPDPLAILVDGDPATAGPIYVEAQVPVWYARFVARGGETPALRARRGELVRRAFEIRKLAESSCRDERAYSLARPFLDRADPIRRKGQDLLFGSTREEIEAAAGEFQKAEDLYRQAARAAEDHIRAFDLLDRLRDELPYYGDWLAHGLQGMDDEYLRLLERAGTLAELAYAPVGNAGSSRETLAEAVEATRKLDESFHRDAARSILWLSRSNDWREVDGLLRLPMLDREVRAGLLDRVGSKALSPPLDSPDLGSSVPEVAPPDPAFWQRAVGLARVEAGLLRLAGLDASDLESASRQAKANWEKNPDAARAALSSAARAATAARSRLVEDLDDPSRPGGWDRVVCALPHDALKRLGAGRIEDRSRPEFRAMIAWQATRLCDDFAADEARELVRPYLENARSDGNDPIRKALDLAEARLAARLTIADSRGDPAKVVVEHIGDLPEGLAAAFVPRDAATSSAEVTVLDGDRPDLPGLLDAATKRPTTLAFFREGVPIGRQSPVLFYRGHVFRRFEDVKDADLVAVRIEQKDLETVIPWKVSGDKASRAVPRTIPVPDQFRRNSKNVYLYPSNRLDYRLILQNETSRSLSLYVSYGLATEDLPLATKRLVLEAGTISRDIVGSISAGDLLPDAAPSDFVIEVREGDANGRRVAEDVRLKCRKVLPTKEDITVIFSGWNVISPKAGLLRLTVFHSNTSKVTAPMFFSMKLEPGNEVGQVDHNTLVVPYGEARTYEYRIPLSAQKITYSLDVGSVTLNFDPFELNAPPKPPAPLPAVTPAPGVEKGP